MDEPISGGKNSFPGNSATKKRRSAPPTVPVHEHWARAYSLNNSDDDKFREIFINDRTSLVVAASLLMTIDFAALAINPSAFIKEMDHNIDVVCVSYIYVICFAIAIAMSICSVMMGTWQYLTINKFSRDVQTVVNILEATVPRMLTPVNSMHIAVASTCIGTIAGVYLTYGWSYAIAFAIPNLMMTYVSIFFCSLCMHKVEVHFFGDSTHPLAIRSLGKLVRDGSLPSEEGICEAELLPATSTASVSRPSLAPVEYESITDNA